LYQRTDDTPETVRARLVTYHRQTEPVIDYYDLIKLLVTIPGHGPVEDVKRATLAAIRRLGSRGV
jgi:adenylate kinase